ncbi:lysine exporter LysO family protein [uncultured Alistipes sp.]|uniref:lysine exporter LysO family protein n=1 Tax=uncultured Alistipes sp. TaxID=538949 RepID=UPI0026359DF1|nr:lysine exporter LysO family protein [uncultured Alistipes sp.]
MTGRLCRGRRLAFVPRLIAGVIRALLFLLGLEVGSDPAVVGGMATLGAAAFLLFAGAVGGSIGAAWLLWRLIRRRAAACTTDGTGEERTERGGAPAAGETAPAATSLWNTLRGSLVIVAFFVAGLLAGLCLPPRALPAGASTAVLYLLMYCVGITLGHDEMLARRVRRLDPRLALLPLATAGGTLAGAALVTPLLGEGSVTDSLAVGAGFGYYSLSSIFIADMRGPELATVALLCNVMRELFTLVAAPLVSRWAGPLAAVSIGGATTFDTTLPVITQAAGAPYAVVSVFHGCVLDFSVPFLVTFFCSLG